MAFRSASTFDAMTEAAGLGSDVREFLATGQESDGPAIEDMKVGQARLQMKELLLATAPETGPAVRALDIAIPTAEDEVVVRIYTPESTKNNSLPVVVLLHGGGWVLCDLDCYDGFARYLSGFGNVIVASVEYRLAPEHKFPSGLSDSLATVQWVYNNIQEHGGDPARIIIMGDSAGGTLAAAVCQKYSDEKIRLAGQVLLYPVLDLRNDVPYLSRQLFGGGGYFITEQSIDWTIKHYLNDPGEAQLSNASPILASSFRDLPKTLIITASHDPLRDEGAQYAKLLDDAGVPVEYRCYDGAIHGFFSFAGVLNVGRKGLGDLAAWLAASF